MVITFIEMRNGNMRAINEYVSFSLKSELHLYDNLRRKSTKMCIIFSSGVEFILLGLRKFIELEIDKIVWEGRQSFQLESFKNQLNELRVQYN